MSGDSTAAYVQLFMVAFMAAIAWTYVWWAALIPVALFAALVWAFNH